MRSYYMRTIICDLIIVKMSDGRKRLSGAQYEKLAKEKKQKEEEVLRNTHKIYSFFQPTSKGEHKEQSSTVSANAEQNQLAINTTHNEARDGVSLSSKVSGSDVDGLAFPVVSSDPAMWEINNVTIDYIAKHGIIQNLDVDFSNSRRQYSDKSRVLTKNVFQRRLLNGEVRQRRYLVYSESKGLIYCAPCRLFGGTCALACQGYSDWKNVSFRLMHHENSKEHKECEMAFLKRSNAFGRIDTHLQLQIDGEINYWRNVLKRVVAVVKALSSRGLAFRGKEERFNSVRNGNYLMALELIAEFDPFLAEHIASHGNSGRGSVSYLSSTICDEFIQLMASKVIAQVNEEIKTAKYFSISVDSTPDISHVDQLAFIVRYVKEDGLPVERFLCFIPSPGHKSEQLEKVVLDTLNSQGIDIANCRGQSYDNASNMSGAYNGLQARIKKVNEYAIYVPCSAHSLNLVGVCAAESCREASLFFDLVQHVYNFFSASTRRWELLLSHLKPGSKVIKSLSDTRWSSRAEACTCLFNNWENVIEAITEIEQSAFEKSATRNEATGIRRQLERLESTFLAALWSSLLERFDASNKKLQSIEIDITVVVELYGSLCKFVKTTRDMFEYYEAQAMEISENDSYETDIKRKKKRKLQHEETRDNETELCGREKFKVETFYAIIDCISCELKKRGEAYQQISNRFECLINMAEKQPSELREQAERLQSLYKNDLEESFPNECLHFQSFLRNASDDRKKSKNTVIQMCNLLRSQHLHSVFPNVDIAFRMFLCAPATNCSAERSFSVLKRVKNYLRSRMGEERLNALSILSIESEIMLSLSYNDIINSFAEDKARRKRM